MSKSTEKSGKEGIAKETRNKDAMSKAKAGKTGSTDAHKGKVSKADATRERLLKVALEAFESKGFDETGMRDLAKSAGLSLGAFYYHFKQKEDIVQVYYDSTFHLFDAGATEIFQETSKFEERLTQTVALRMKTFQPQRNLLVALSRSAVDPKSTLSPFSESQKEIRDKNIDVFRKMIEDSDLKYHKKLAPYLPALLWMYMMGVLFYWVFDSSPKQRNTFQLIEKLTPLVARLLSLSRLPLTGRVIQPIVEILEVTIKS